MASDRHLQNSPFYNELRYFQFKCKIKWQMGYSPYKDKRSYIVCLCNLITLEEGKLMGECNGGGYGGVFTSTATILVLYILLVIVLRTF